MDIETIQNTIPKIKSEWIKSGKNPFVFLIKVYGVVVRYGGRNAVRRGIITTLGRTPDLSDEGGALAEE